MIETLIKLLERVGIEDGCGAFDGLCRSIDCSECPFYSHTNMDRTIGELKKANKEMRRDEQKR